MQALDYLGMMGAKSSADSRSPQTTIQRGPYTHPAHTRYDTQHVVSYRPEGDASATYLLNRTRRFSSVSSLHSTPFTRRF